MVTPAMRTRAVERWTRGVGIAATLGITAVELLRCGSMLSIPDGVASSATGVLVLGGTPFFVGMAMRQWVAGILGGLAGLYVLVWMCHLISDISIHYDPPMGLVLMVIYPVGWLAMASGWLGSRIPWVLLRVGPRSGVD